ncbi:MAG: hypothetical protein KKE44_11385, partial [Proteobacteria bacterium]|nr:hypothetical protein [Pseudomonadota bacterium]
MVDTVFACDSLNRRILETKSQDVSTGGLDTDNINYSAYTRFKSATYDAASNITQITKTDSSKITYSYDFMERNTRVTHNSVIQQEFAYDALNRLLTSSATDKPSLSWTYDCEGNWTGTDQNGPQETRTVNNDNQYTLVAGQSQTYDANGNMTSHNGLTLVYDWADRLVQVKAGGVVKQEYFYDAQNRRVKQKDYTTGQLITTEYVYTGSQVIEEYKDTVLSKTFVYADYIDDPIVMTTGSDRYYYVKDRQYAIKAVTDDAGVILESYEYSAYGVMTIF